MPVHLTSPVFAIVPFKHAFRRGGLPIRIHAEQVDEEIIRQSLRLVGEDAIFRLPVVGIQNAQAAEKNRHLGSSQRQQLCPIEQQLFRRDRVPSRR